MLQQVVLFSIALSRLRVSTPIPSPRSYWRFEGDTSTWGRDTSTHGNNLTTTANSTAAFAVMQTGGLVGGFLHVNGSSPTSVLAAAAGAWNCSSSTRSSSKDGCTGSTVEFIFRAGRYFNNKGASSIISSHVAGNPMYRAYAVEVGRHSLDFHTGSDPTFPAVDIAGWDVIANLEGVGITSPSQLFDGQWHHLAFVQNGLGLNKEDTETGGAPANCSVAVWLDGQRPSDIDYHRKVWWRSNATATSLHRTNCKLLLTEPIDFLPSTFDGDIDEVAIWEVPLTDAMIYAHSQDALKHHRAYTLGTPTSSLPPAPAPVPLSGAFNLKEFAVGTVLPTPFGTVTSGVNVSCLAQLQSFPSPRFPPNPTPFKVAPLSNCMDPRYMAGENQKNVTKEEMQDGAIGIQRELATRWNYALFLGNIDQVAFDHHATWYTKVFALVDSMPETPFEAEIIRANIYNDSLPRGPDNTMALHNQHLPDSCYLQTANGTFIDYKSRAVPNATKHRYLRVTSVTSQAKLCPDTHFDSDGEYFANAFTRMARNISKPRALIRVWDDGEILAGQCESGAHFAYEQDPEMVKDYDCCSKLPNITFNGIPNQRDWRSYASLWRLRITARFRDLFMRTTGPILATAAYSEFEVEGSTAYFGRWPILREIMTPGGVVPATKAMPRHATVDMYVTHPREWDVGAGSWHGVDWLSMVLPSQIASGDNVYTPFVSPGWNAAEEKNVRPAQWLGLLKMVAVTGALV